MSWRLVFTKQAIKDAQKIVKADLKTQTNRLLGILKENPYQNPPPYEKLVGDLAGAYCRRMFFAMNSTFAGRSASRRIK